MRVLLGLLLTLLHTNIVADALLSARLITRSASTPFSFPGLSIAMASSSCDNNKTAKKRALYSFDEARKIARGHGFGNLQEFLDYDCPGAYQLPKNADVVWRDDWTTWEDFLGLPMDFSEARRVAHAHVGPASKRKIATEADYKELFESKTLADGDIVSRLPYRPDLKYKTKGWISWEDFLQE